MNNILQFIKDYQAIVGIFIGSFLTVFVQYSTNKSLSRIRITEVVINKRILAYEQLYNKLKELRYMTPIAWNDENDPEEKLERMPQVLQSKDTLDTYISDTTNIFQQNTQWFNIDLIREYYFFQDYIINLRNIFSKVNEENTTTFGVIVRQDFIDLSSSFDKIMLKYFSNNIYSKTYFPIFNRWHKYKKNITESRLLSMKLYNDADKIAVIQNKDLIN